MIKHPMYSVKEAAVVLGCDERWIREQLNQGQLKGEKKNIGLKEKWFVYKGEVDNALARKGAISGSVQNTSENNDFFGIADNVEEPPVDVHVRSAAPVTEHTTSIEDIVRAMADKFAEKLDEAKSYNYQLQRELEEKDRQLKLLPDLQKRAEEANLKEFELQALRKQLEHLELLRQNAEIQSQKVLEFEDSIVPELKQQIESEKASKAHELSTIEQQRREAERKLEEERRLKEIELKNLQAEIAAVEEYKKAADEAKQKIEQLERAAQDRNKDDEEKDAALEELKRAQEEKDAHVTAMQVQVAALSEKLEKSSKSWWHKFFLGTNA